MINRVLIRLKVVQLLYSHFIGDSSFNIEEPAETQTREKRFAYQLYLDTLAMMVRVADSIRQKDGYRPLADTKFIIMVRSDEKVAGVLRRSAAEYRFGVAEREVAEQLKKSALYKNYVKDEAHDPRIWEDIFRMFILSNPVYNEAVTSFSDYTLHGLERMRELMDKTFAKVYASADGRQAAKALEHSLNLSRELYFRLLTLPIAMTRVREQELEERRLRYNASPEDRNPNMRFVENKLVKLLEADSEICDYVESRKSQWLPEDRLDVAAMLKTVMESEVYAAYMESKSTSLRDDVEFWRSVYKDVLLQSDSFLKFFEDKSVFWNDDFHIIGEFVLKTFKRFATIPPEEWAKGKEPVMPMYKDEEDASFGRELFVAVTDNRLYYRQLIARAVEGSSWDAERLAFMDSVIICTALAEILNFPNIPLRVSVNEYVEIAKWYSTAKSGRFIHGLLANIINSLKEEGKLRK